MAEVQRLKQLTLALQKRSAEIAKTGNVVVLVGYTAAYALWVHENVEMKWRGLPRDRSIRKDAAGIARYGYKAQNKRGLFWGPQGQAKFLEQPARMFQPELAQIVTTAMAKGKTLAQALMLAGLRLQRESQKLVPVDTGNLRNSAFTRFEK